MKKPKPWTSKKADETFSKYIRFRDKKCFFCGKTKLNGIQLQTSHFWGRENSATRYSPLNCDAVCGGCHMRHESNKQGLYRELKIKQLGQENYNALEFLARSIVKRSDAIKIWQDTWNREGLDFLL